MGFDKSDSVTCTLYDYMAMTARQDSAIAPMQLNHWYKCVIEVDFAAAQITYSLDGQVVRHCPLPTADWYGIDRLLVFRGTNPEDLAGGTDSLTGPRPYYADDLVLYKK
jgi:hypothetical protein